MWEWLGVVLTLLGRANHNGTQAYSHLRARLGLQEPLPRYTPGKTSYIFPNHFLLFPNAKYLQRSPRQQYLQGRLFGSLPSSCLPMLSVSVFSASHNMTFELGYQSRLGIHSHSSLLYLAGHFSNTLSMNYVRVRP